MAGKCFVFREILITVVTVGILAALFLPMRCGGGGCSRDGACAGNLRQLYTLATVYASTHKGVWPAATGSDLWLSFTSGSPRLIEPGLEEVLGCPVRGDWEPGECHYLGPRKGVSELGPHDALGGDKPGNHGEGSGGNVLFKDGSIREVELTDPIWSTLSP